MRWTPFSSSGEPNASTERAPIKYCLMEMGIAVDGGGHLLRTNLLLCRSVCERFYRSYWFCWRCPICWMDPNTFFFNLGKERTAMTSLVLFRLVPQGRIELRRTLQTIYKLSVWGWTYSLDYRSSVDIKYTMDPGVPNHGETDLPSFPRSERETNESGEISGLIKKMAFVFRIVYLVLLYAFPCLGFKTKGV